LLQACCNCKHDRRNLHHICTIASAAAAVAAGLNAHATDKLNGTHATPTEGQAYYDQQPELLESLFYLWRFTGNETYRDWGWQIFRAMRMWTRWVASFCGSRRCCTVSILELYLASSRRAV
jgi:hypothetical protein